MPGYDPKINISEIAKQSQIKGIRVEEKLSLSSKSSNIEKEHNMVILDINPGATKEIKDFSCNLNTDLVITELCDVYLEYISLHALTGNDNKNIESFHTFLLKMAEISTKVISNNNQLTDKFIIPNETYGINDNVADTAGGVDAGGGLLAPITSMVVKLKSNYVSTMYPKTIKTIKITLEGLKTDGTIETIKCGTGGRLQIGLLFKNR